MAIGFEPARPHDFLAAVNALLDLVPGDHPDIMDRDRAGGQQATSPAMNASTLARPMSSGRCSGGDFIR